MVKLKEYEVTVDQTWSETVKVKAKNKAEAKRLGFEKWKKKIKKTNYDIEAEELERW